MKMRNTQIKSVWILQASLLTPLPHKTEASHVVNLSYEVLMSAVTFCGSSARPPLQNRILIGKQTCHKNLASTLCPFLLISVLGRQWHIQLLPHLIA